MAASWRQIKSSNLVALQGILDIWTRGSGLQEIWVSLWQTLIINNVYLLPCNLKVLQFGLLL